MKFFQYFLLITLCGCQSISPINVRNERTEVAYIFANNLAADGCIENVQLLSDKLRFRPTSSTLPILQKAFNEIPPNTTSLSERAVTVRFIETGQQVTLSCGWGVQFKVGEIELLEVRPR